MKMIVEFKRYLFSESVYLLGLSWPHFFNQLQRPLQDLKIHLRNYFAFEQRFKIWSPYFKVQKHNYKSNSTVIHVYCIYLLYVHIYTHTFFNIYRYIFGTFHFPTSVGLEVFLSNPILRFKGSDIYLVQNLQNELGQSWRYGSQSRQRFKSHRAW